MAFILTPKKIKELNNPEEQKITCTIKKFIFKDKETGFFVFAAEIPEGQANVKGTLNGAEFAIRKFTAVGTSYILTQSISEKQDVEIWGKFEEGKKPNTTQFSVTSLQEVIPTKPKAIELFLSSGKIPWIGEKTAKKIVDVFGPETIKILDTDPKKLLDINGINQTKLENIITAWKDWRSVYEIVSTMRLYGIGDAAGVKIFNMFKEKSLYVIKNEPYELTTVPGIGFITADKIALQIGKSPNDPKRVEKCILFQMQELAENGHTFYHKDEVIYKTNEILKVDQDLVAETVEKLISTNELVQKPIKIKKFKDKNRINFYFEESLCIAHRAINNTEAKIAKELKRIIDFPLEENEQKLQKDIEKFLKENKFNLDESQINAARIILSNKVSVLTGGPGTGKTHTINSLIHYFDTIHKRAVFAKDENPLQFGAKSVLSAPTGRAAKRMEEATRKQSQTMHRLLKLKDGSFFYNETNRLKGDVFITDESSMIDIWLGNGFLKAIPSAARLIFVGDIDQLPSVGPGNFLRDMIDSGKVPVARLSTIHRQALNSNIIVAAHNIIHRKTPPLHDFNSTSDFVFIEADGSDNVHNEIITTVNKLLSSGVEPSEIQILSPKKDGEIGVNNLNNSLRPLLNPNNKYSNKTESKFIVGDRVMQFKNNKELDIYNGDIGHVVLVDEENVKYDVNFDGRVVTIEGQDLQNLNLSYATTIHKSQGSDYPYVIIPLSKSHLFMWDVNLLYTAVTRGKKKVILIGDKKTLFMSIASFKQKDRITGLKEEITNEFSPKENKIAKISLI
jgi:exodeoxyribonuclease V alpha subunit